MTRMHFLLDQ